MNGMSWECRIIGVFFYINYPNKLPNPSSASFDFVESAESSLFVCLFSEREKRKENGEKAAGSSRHSHPHALNVIFLLWYI